MKGAPRGRKGSVKMKVRNTWLPLGVWVAVALPGCRESTAADQSLIAAAKTQVLDPALCAPSQPGFTPTATNPYFPIAPGRQWVYEGNESGAAIRLEITVLNQQEPVAGVTTQVVEERETNDGVLVEVSRNFFAQAHNGAVCYFGEAVDIYEGGVIVSHEGSWRADDPGNAPGIIMPQNPEPGQKFKVELAPGVAEDEATIVSTGRVKVPAGTFPDAIKIRDFNPLDGGKGRKAFAAGVGLIVDGAVELVSYTP